MGQFKRYNSPRFNKLDSGERFGARDPERSGSRFGRRDSGRFEDRDSRGGRRDGPEMFDATCDKCGKNCEVPFRPTSGKPVYCSACFKNNDSHISREKFERAPRSEISSSGLQEINLKLDKILKALKID